MSKASNPIPPEEVFEALKNDDLVGWCVACGEKHDGPLEPDTRESRCPCCGEFQVFGAEQLVLEGFIS